VGNITGGIQICIANELSVPVTKFYYPYRMRLILETNSNQDRYTLMYLLYNFYRETLSLVAKIIQIYIAVALNSRCTSYHV
jgi:hypothetical protein